MYQTIAITCLKFFGLSALTYKYTKTLIALTESIIYNHSNKTKLINYLSFTLEFYLFVSLLKITIK